MFYENQENVYKVHPEKWRFEGLPNFAMNFAPMSFFPPLLLFLPIAIIIHCIQTLIVLCTPLDEYGIYQTPYNISLKKSIEHEKRYKSQVYHIPKY